MKNHLAAQVAQIRADVVKAHQDHHNFGGLGYPTYDRQQTLLAYIALLEKTIDSAIDDLEAIRTCSDEQVISEAAASAQTALCEAYDHEAYRARQKA